MSAAVRTQREPELLGQTVVLIGGSAGIGLETARRARSEGADVILTGRNPERLEQAARDVDARSTAALRSRKLPLQRASGEVAKRRKCSCASLFIVTRSLAQGRRIGLASAAEPRAFEEECRASATARPPSQVRTASPDLLDQPCRAWRQGLCHGVSGDAQCIRA